MNHQINSPRTQGAGRNRAGERSDVSNITQSHPHFANPFSDLRDSLPIHTEMRDRLDKQIFGSMSDDSFERSSIAANEHLKAQGLHPIWRKADSKRLRRIAIQRFLESSFDRIGA
jgi:hypothetical protein